MQSVSLPSRASWIGEGLRWIGSIFVDAGDWLDKPSEAAPLALEPVEFMPPEEHVFNLRHRIHTGSEMF